MSTIDKNFKVKNGLDVAGTATFDTNIVLGSAPIVFDVESGRLKIQINGNWSSFAFISDVAASQGILFTDLDLALDYNGQPVYSAGGQGVQTSANVFADAGTPSTTSYSLTFDSGTV